MKGVVSDKLKTDINITTSGRTDNEMTAKKTIRKRNLIKPEQLEKWTDEEVLTNLSTLLTRAIVSTDFVSEELDGHTIFTHEVMTAVSGDKAMFSEPRALDWPLQMMPMPEAFKGKELN